MATTHAPRIVRKRADLKPAHSRRRASRYGRFLKHPINSLWGLFSSVKTAIVLIALIAIVCIIGIIVIQAPVEITSSPSDYAAWVQQEMVGKYGQAWATIFNNLGFFTIFSSWYFRTLMALLAVNVAICTMNRAPGIWYNFRHPAVRTNERFYQNALARQEFDTDQDVEGIRRFFRKRHYRVLVKEGSANGATYLYAYKNSWATLSTFVFHACLVALMLATVITDWQGFGQNSMAQRILPAPIFNYLQSLAGFSYTQPLPDGESGVVYPIGTPHNIEYRADKFVATFDPKTGQPTDFYTDVTLFQDGRQVAQQRVRVNDPLTYQGVTFHQASFIMYAWIVITDDKGNIIFNQKPVLDQSLNEVNPNTGDTFQVNLGEDIPIPNLQAVMNVDATLAPTGWVVVVNGTDINGKPDFCGFAPAGGSSPVIDLSQSDLDCSHALAARQLGQPLKLKGWTLNVKTVQRGTVLLITKDAGSPLIWPISALLILSLCVTFYFPQRRVWIRFRDGHVQFAGLKEHFINVQRDFNTLAMQILALDAKADRHHEARSSKDPPPAKATKKPEPVSAKSGKIAAASKAKDEDAKAASVLAAEAEAETDTGDEAVLADNEAATAEEAAKTAAPDAAEEKTEVTAGD